MTVEHGITRQRSKVPDICLYAYTKRVEGCFNDVIIKVGDEAVPANRMVLSCCSEVFEKMFLLEMREKSEYKIDMKDIDAKSMKMIIDYMYTGSIVISNETVISLLSVANYLLLTEVKHFCSDFLESSIDLDNCFSIFNIAFRYQCDKLKEKARKFIGSNLNHLSQTATFKNLTKQELISCLSNLNRNQTMETSLYEALITWVRYELHRRRKEIPDVMQLVDFAKLSFGYLSDLVLKEALICDFPSLMKSIIDESKENKIKLGCTVLSFGGMLSDRKVIELFNTFQKTPTNYPDLPIPTIDHCSIKLDDAILCIGGCDTTFNESYSHVWKMTLNEANLKWELSTPLNIKKQLLAAAQFQNHLVIAGGYNEGKVLNLAEVNTIELTSWQAISPLQTSRCTHCLVECGGYLFAIGGCSAIESLSSVEQLSELNANWCNVKSMQTPRQWFAAVSLNGYIYAIAGYTLANRATLKNVEKYNVATDEWSYIQDLNIERKWHAACVVNGKIYVVGGCNDSDEIVKEIECYDPEIGVWKCIGKTTHSLVNHSLVVV